MLAQRYPDDCDGILAGAPAHALTSLYIGWAQFQSHLLKEPAALRRFVARGGKLILWHGWNDVVVQPSFTVDYHERLRIALGSEAVRKSVRLFMAPGVEHGIGGPGADRFGQLSAGDGDPERSLGAALRRWVEDDVAPERVIAVRHRVPNDPKTDVVRTRPLRPRRARHRSAACSRAS